MRLLIYGSKDFATTVSDLARHCGYEVVGMVDDFNSGPGILGSLTDVIHSHPPAGYSIAIAIGYDNIRARWAAWLRARTAGYQTPALVHSQAYVANSAQIGEGSLVMARSIVDQRAELNELIVLWPGSCINHDACLKHNTFISPNATVCGHAIIGEHCFIGAGAVITDYIEVPPDTFVKAGRINHETKSK